MTLYDKLRHFRRGGPRLTCSTFYVKYRKCWHIFQIKVYLKDNILYTVLRAIFEKFNTVRFDHQSELMVIMNKKIKIKFRLVFFLVFTMNTELNQKPLSSFGDETCRQLDKTSLLCTYAVTFMHTMHRRRQIKKNLAELMCTI
jgi:hypothetical protein